MNQSITAIDADAVLMGVREKMPVYDLMNEKIGKIRYIQFASDTSDEALISSDQHLQEAPDPVRTRLLKTGFIRIDTGLLRKDAYATTDQIEGIEDDRVRLNVPRQRLMHF